MTFKCTFEEADLIEPQAVEMGGIVNDGGPMRRSGVDPSHDHDVSTFASSPSASSPSDDIPPLPNEKMSLARGAGCQGKHATRMAMSS